MEGRRMGDEFARQWLFEVGQNLSPKGFQLLKVLYLNTLPFRTLSDYVNQPYELHSALSGNWSVAEQRDDERVLETERMSPRDSLALLVHRLRVLVPSPSAELRSRKGLGAQECLERLPAASAPSSFLTVEISQESKMLECLVKTYVNLTPRQRVSLTRHLGQEIGTHAENLTTYQLLGCFFTTYKTRIEEGVAVFAKALRHVKSPSACDQLEENLSSYDIPHEPIQIPDEYEADEEVEHEVTPLLKKQQKRQERKVRQVILRALKILCCHCVPIILGILLLSIGMAVFSTYLSPVHETKTIETSNYQLRCPTGTSSFPAQPIRVWKFDTFWYNSMIAKQEADYNYYWPLTAYLYLIPDDKLRVYRRNYTCWCDAIPNCDSAYNIFRGVYLLKGSSIEFSLVINSTSATENGHFNITICDDEISFNNQPPSCSVDLSLTIGPRETDVPMNETFVAPRDSYYYITTATSVNAIISSYHVGMEILFLNSSDWNGLTEATEFHSYDAAGISQSIYHRNGLSSMFTAASYTVVAKFDTKYDQGNMGQMMVTKYHRNLVYVVPAIAAVSFMLLGVILVACICICHCIVKRIIRHRRKGRELSSPIN